MCVGRMWGIRIKGHRLEIRWWWSWRVARAELAMSHREALSRATICICTCEAAPSSGRDESDALKTRPIQAVCGRPCPGPRAFASACDQRHSVPTRVHYCSGRNPFGASQKLWCSVALDYMPGS